MAELLTVAQVAAILKVSEDTVLRRFAKVNRVIDLGSSEGKKKRRYRVLRIPRAVVEKYLSTKAGHPVHITVPERPERRRKSPKWIDRSILNLAKAGVQNECKDRAVFQLIAKRARSLSIAPQEYRAEMMEGPWFDEEED